MFWQYLCDTTQKPSLVKATVSAARRAGCLWYAYVPDIFVSGKKETAELLLCGLAAGRSPPGGAYGIRTRDLHTAGVARSQLR